MPTLIEEAKAKIAEDLHRNKVNLVVNLLEQEAKIVKRYQEDVLSLRQSMDAVEKAETAEQLMRIKRNRFDD